MKQKPDKEISVRMALIGLVAGKIVGAYQNADHANAIDENVLALIVAFVTFAYDQIAFKVKTWWNARKENK